MNRTHTIAGFESRPRGPIASSILLVGLLVPLVFVAARVVLVQATMQEEYAEPWSRTTTIERAIPARNGRILTADGQVLARDDFEYDLHVHYRWIEQPPNKNWLRKQARLLLSPSERRDEQMVARAESEVLEQRESVWAELSALDAGVPATRLEIQERVERIRTAVEARRSERTQARTKESGQRGLFERIWYELTHAPERYGNDPLILKEELAYHSLGELPSQVVQRVLDRPNRFEGFDVRTVPKRRYPGGMMASHVIGFRGVSTAEMSEESQRARAMDESSIVGRAGLEQAYDVLLRGRSGTVSVERQRDGVERDQRVVLEASHGQDLTLSIDARLQAVAEQALEDVLANSESAVGGAVIVMDVATGGLPVLASAPGVSPSIYDKPDPAEWAAVRDDPRRPLFSRATQMALPPGSVFKLPVAVAALESGWVPEREVFCQGYFRTPDRERCALFRIAGYGHDRLTIDHALGLSCNVFFFELAEVMGAEQMTAWARQCGFGWETGIDVAGEAAGSVPDDSDFRYTGSVRQFAIGQGSLTTTPLQIARLTAAIANDGRLLRPRVAIEREPQAAALPVKRETLQTIRKGMALAVHGPSGTARSLASLPVRVAGKTGSAEVDGDRESHAWFTGYFPMDQPRYAITVAIEHGGSGGKVAAPVAAAVIGRAAAIDPTLGQR